MVFLRFLLVVTALYTFSPISNMAFAAPDRRCGNKVTAAGKRKLSASDKLKKALILDNDYDSMFEMEDVLDGVRDSKARLSRIQVNESGNLSLSFSTINDYNTDSGEFFDAKDWKLKTKGDRLVLSASKDDGAKQLKIEFFVDEKPAGINGNPGDAAIYMEITMSNMGVENRDGSFSPFVGHQLTHIESAFEFGDLFVNNGLMYSGRYLATERLTVERARSEMIRVMRSATNRR